LHSGNLWQPARGRTEVGAASDVPPAEVIADTRKKTNKVRKLLEK
jgi:hypothetical protein